MYKEVLAKAGYIYADGFGKGYPIWTNRGLEFQRQITRLLLDIISQYFTISLYNPPLIVSENEYRQFYKNRIDQYGNTPIFSYNGKNKILVTDALPYSLKKLCDLNTDAIVANYSIIRLLNCKLVPMYRDYYISPIIQINIKSSKKVEELIKITNTIIAQFLRIINIPSIILEYDGRPGYSSKVYMASAVNKKGVLQSIIQFSVLSEDLLSQFGINSNKSYILDIGFSQKLFALWADNNSDANGLYIPSKFNKNFAVVIYNKDFQINDNIAKLRNITMNEQNIIFCDLLGKTKLKKLKNHWSSLGIGVFIIHRVVDNHDYFSCYSRNLNTEIIIDGITSLIAYISKMTKIIDIYYYERMNEVIDLLLSKGYGRISEFKQLGRIV